MEGGRICKDKKRNKNNSVFEDARGKQRQNKARVEEKKKASVGKNGEGTKEKKKKKETEDLRICKDKE